MKTLLLDIETIPNLGYTWGKYEQNVIAFVKEWEILTVAWKWLGEKKTYALGVNTCSEYGLLKNIHAEIAKADIVIAHNGDAFDMKKLNARFIYHGLKAPEPYKTIDTLKVARRYFAFTSNKLDDLGKHLGLGEKVNTGGFELWEKCMAGDEKAFEKMLRYNKQDVKLLEKVYLRLRPYMPNHPNINVLDESEDGVLKCPTCGKKHLQKRGFYATLTGKRQRYQCQDCGSWSKGKFTRTIK